MRDQLSCVPFYAKRAAKMEAETGDPMAYWNVLWGYTPNIGVPLTNSGAVDARRLSETEIASLRQEHQQDLIEMKRILGQAKTQKNC